MPYGLVVLALLAASPEAAAPAPSVIEALEVEVRSVPPPSVAGVVASDPRFAALTAAEREALLRALAIAPGWRIAASATNLVIGFGIGSLLESDARGLILTATDTVALVILLFALTGAIAESSTGSTSALDVAPVAAGLLVAGRIAGVILPWTWDGRYHAAAAKALGQLPPPRPATLLVAPLVASATGRTAPGATLLLRF